MEIAIATINTLINVGRERVKIAPDASGTGVLQEMRNGLSSTPKDLNANWGNLLVSMLTEMEFGHEFGLLGVAAHIYECRHGGRALPRGSGEETSVGC